MPLYDEMIILSKDEYDDIKTQNNSSSVDGDGSQVNNIDVENGKVIVIQGDDSFTTNNNQKVKSKKSESSKKNSQTSNKKSVLSKSLASKKTKISKKKPTHAFEESDDDQDLFLSNLRKQSAFTKHSPFASRPGNQMYANLRDRYNSTSSSNHHTSNIPNKIVISPRDQKKHLSYVDIDSMQDLPSEKMSIDDDDEEVNNNQVLNSSSAEAMDFAQYPSTSTSSSIKHTYNSQPTSTVNADPTSTIKSPSSTSSTATTKSHSTSSTSKSRSAKKSSSLKSKSKSKRSTSINLPILMDTSLDPSSIPKRKTQSLTASSSLEPMQTDTSITSVPNLGVPMELSSQKKRSQIKKHYLQFLKRHASKNKNISHPSSLTRTVKLKKSRKLSEPASTSLSSHAKNYDNIMTNLVKERLNQLQGTTSLPQTDNQHQTIKNPTQLSQDDIQQQSAEKIPITSQTNIHQQSAKRPSKADYIISNKAHRKSDFTLNQPLNYLNRYKQRRMETVKHYIPKRVESTNKYKRRKDESTPEEDEDETQIPLKLKVGTRKPDEDDYYDLWLKK